MKSVYTVASAFTLLFGVVTVADAQSGNLFIQTNLVSNIKGAAVNVDPNLVDPWGISFSATSPFWVSNHGSGTSTLYNGAGAVNPLVVTIPPGAASGAGAVGKPTGQVRNGTANVFKLANGNAASFIFATEDGTISGWNGGTTAAIWVDKSAASAVYKGLAIGNSAAGPTLYAANFRSGAIDVFDSNWAPTTLAGGFLDPQVASGYAPFNIWNLNNTLFVTYAKQDANKFLDVPGLGNGYVSIFDLNGNLLNHFVDDHSIRGLFQGPVLNSPWGVAIAPPIWGPFGGAALIANFGDGKINAFDLQNGRFLGAVSGSGGVPISISGLWAIAFGNGGNGGDVNTLYFLAGVPNGSTSPRGLLGSLAPPAMINTLVNAASQLPGGVAPGELVKIGGQTVGATPAQGAIIPPAISMTLPTTLAGVSATVGGIAAPVLYTAGNQTNIQIPYGVTVATTVDVVLTVGTQVTNKYPALILPTNPGLFTFDYTGFGRLVALNADGSVNSATNPAARGSAIWLFATGTGITKPPDMDGIGEIDSSHVPVAPISVTVGGAPATLGINGSTPKSVAGVTQIMVTVPTTIPAGQAAVVLISGGSMTSTNVFVYVN